MTKIKAYAAIAINISLFIAPKHARAWIIPVTRTLIVQAEPLVGKNDMANFDEHTESAIDVSFEELFDLNDIQLLQDEFAKATGVASIITKTDGTPITKPSQFTRFCNDVVRKTELGCANCYRSDAAIGQLSPDGPTIQPCMSGGLWDAGAGISVDGKHIANWLIGQVRDAAQNEQSIRIYARRIGADEDVAASAFHDVPSMSKEKFRAIAQMLFTLANQLSGIAYQNLRQKRLISELKVAETRLQLAANVFIYAREGIMITDASANIIDVNETFSNITGYAREDVLGKSPRLLKSGAHDQRFYSTMWESLKDSGNWSGEIWNRHKDGNTYIQWLTISAVRTCEGDIQNYVALFTDITQQKRYERQLQHLAHYDALTGLPNRTLFTDRLAQAIANVQRNKQSLAVVYLDLDSFKQVNDQYGHEIGDKFLIAIAQCMKSAMRDIDTLARIGGDEFVAILVNLESPDDCKPVLERLLHAAASRVRINGLTLESSASIGVTLYPQDASDAEQLLRHSDQAMYQAKQSGKNRYHLFDVRHAHSEKQRLEQLERIGIALQRNEFVVYYQPKVNMRSGDIIGAEALIRWQHPHRGLLPPSSFLPLVENQDLSVDIGEWVINAALGQIVEWRKDGLDIPVSVNLFARQLQQENFVDTLSRILTRHHTVRPHQLKLEITETSALERMSHVLEIMHSCQKIGVSFALDDFGTGYSSLIYLKRLPFDILKIDQSFIRNMLDNPEDLAIVKGVIGLANAFRREVVAEGVETKAHAKMLLAIGCDLAQGYGIARPMPAKDLVAWAAKWKTIRPYSHIERELDLSPTTH